MKSLLGLGLVLAMIWPVDALRAGDFIRGDANADGIVDISDPVKTLQHLFLGGPSDCRDAMDTNDDGVLNLADPIYEFAYLFTSGLTPPAPFPWCDADPTDTDPLDCQSNVTCDLGGPIGGLTADEIRSFHRGRLLMIKRFTPSEGLGPFYNTTSCGACHEVPVNGGSASHYRNFFLVGVGAPGMQVKISWNPPIPSLVLPLYHNQDGERPLVPASTPGAPVAMALRNAPSMFGTGLFEFVSNATILSNADPDDVLTPDGVSGRFNTDGLGHIGRFGYKLQANFIEPFIRGAAQNQMGMTTNPVEGSAGVVSLSMRHRQVATSLDSPTVDNDGVPDPEISVADFADIINFSRFMRPPEKKTFGPDEIAGEILFDQIGCTKCHVPEIPSSVGPLGAYTDLLLHDMGPVLSDGLAMGIPMFSSTSPLSTENEFRTQPLWGVSMHGPWLHNGMADTLQDAITLHGGEAESIKLAYLGLTAPEQLQVIRFLEAL
ncbi:MAG: di-heme oxidoredictase family protein [Planctomycetota bacterium]